MKIAGSAHCMESYANNVSSINPFRVGRRHPPVAVPVRLTSRVVMVLVVSLALLLVAAVGWIYMLYFRILPWQSILAFLPIALIALVTRYIEKRHIR
jgi:hypothetical protein